MPCQAASARSNWAVDTPGGNMRRAGALKAGSAAWAAPCA
jgi:hypothetical protein